MKNLGRYTKAVVGALVAALSAYQVAQVDNVITQQEWVQVAVAFVAALGLVWGVPNSPTAEPATVPATDVDTDGEVVPEPLDS